MGELVGVTTLNGGETCSWFEEFNANCKNDGFNNFWHEQVVFAEHADPENRRRSIGVAFHKSVVGAGTFHFPAALSNQMDCAADVLQCSTRMHAKYWDYRPFHTQRTNWSSTDLKIFTLGYCILRVKICYPMTPSRVFHPMGLLSTCLASGNTGLVRTIKLRALDGLYCTLVRWIQLLQKKKSSAVRRGGCDSRPRSTKAQTVKMQEANLCILRC